MQGKGQSVKKTTVSNAEDLLATERRAAREPVEVEMVPIQHHPAAELDERRDAAILDASPAEGDFCRKILAEKINPFGLDGPELVQVDATGQETSVG